MKEELENICEHYYISRTQCKNEQARGIGNIGTEGYERQGCYECNGYKTKKECRSYLNFKE